MNDMHPLIEEARRIGKERLRRMKAYKGPPMPFVHLGNNREADMPWLSHEEAAGTVRMLLRSDLDHETVTCMARDRILHLAQENERLRAVLKFYADPFAWKAKNDPENDVQVPDFYSETSFGDMASEALAVTRHNGGGE